MQAPLPPPKPPAIETRILAGESASVALRDWCAAHGLPGLEALRAPGKGRVAGRSVRAALAVQPGEPVRYRRVKLACGGKVLSEADNWYVPGRLTPDMNRQLEATDTPFGLVVRPLAFTRRTLATKALPTGGFEIRAVLTTGAGAPFSYVVEDYSPGLR